MFEQQDSPFPAGPQDLHACLVTACFVDIRGFTVFTEEAVHNVDVAVQAINLLYESLNEALRFANGNIASCEVEGMDPAAFRPKCCKPLGDGAMIVWEHPDLNKPETSKLLGRYVLDFAACLQSAFVTKMRSLEKKFLLDLNDRLGLGMGFSRGTAWRILGRTETEVDYLGRPLNQASRLMALARPFGAFFDLNIDPDLFMERYCLGEGAIKLVVLRGIDRALPVWMIRDQNPDYKICWRRHRTGNLSSACDSLMALPSYGSSGPIPLTSEDLTTIFDEREVWEANFTSDAAQLVAEKKIPPKAIKALEATLEAMEKLLAYEPMTEEILAKWGELGLNFHSQISKISTVNKSEGQLREHYTRQVYQKTRRIYTEAHEHFTLYDTHREHLMILENVKAGSPERVRYCMNEHLSTHYARARKFLLTSAERFEPFEGAP